MDDVNRRSTLSHKALQRRGQRQLRIRVLKRHGPVFGGDGDGRTPIEPSQFLLEKTRVAEGGGHQQKPRLRQRQQRHLPGHAALAVGVVMELVHDDLLDVGLRPFAQGDVSQDLGGAAKDGRVAIDRGVAGAQAHVVRAELAAKGKPLFVDQRLDRAGIDGAFALGQRPEVQGGRDQ